MATFLYSMRFVLLVVFALCIMPVFLFNMGSGKPPPSQLLESSGQDYAATLATCITSSKIRMFGSDRCGNCKRQKALFGDAFKFIDYIDCNLEENEKECQDNKIDRYPTWIQFLPSGEEATRHGGVLSMTQLEEFSACKA